MQALTREQVRAVDRLAIEELGIPGVVLMENAGRNATDAIERYMQGHLRSLTKALIICGGGNNGGDGYVIARHLHNRGVHVHIRTLKPIDRLSGDAAINATICRRMGLDIAPFDPTELERGVSADVVVDAMLGTGFTGKLRPDVLAAIRSVNALRNSSSPPAIVAVDIPSGLDVDTGKPAEDAVHADLTVTFVANKAGFSQPEARAYLGRLEVADIGAPPELVRRVGGFDSNP